MSPSKPSTARTVLRPTGTQVSGIPRRVNPESRLRKPQPSVLGGENKLKATKPSKSSSSSTARDSIFNDKTATPPLRPKSYFSNACGSANKENAAHTRKPRTNGREYSGLRFNGGGSPTKGNTGVSKPSKLSSQPSPTKTALARVPLRELSECEVFVRDEATLGDLRRRRSGEHSGTYIEVASHTAATTVSSISPLPSPAAPAPSGVDADLIALHRTDSAESLRLKLASIISATAPKHTPSRLSLLRKKLESPILTARHPALRTSTCSNDSILCSDPGSPATPVSASPILSRRATSPIVKRTPSPVRRPVGLAKKSRNMVLFKQATEEAETGKKKIVISSSKAVVKKKKGMDSLRRAAGPSRQTTLTRATVGGEKKGIEMIARMR